MIDFGNNKEYIEIYEVICHLYIDDRCTQTKESVLNRFTKIEDANKFKTLYEDLWQVHYDDRTPIYPSWIDCKKGLEIRPVKVYTSF